MKTPASSSIAAAAAGLAILAVSPANAARGGGGLRRDLQAGGESMSMDASNVDFMAASGPMMAKSGKMSKAMSKSGKGGDDDDDDAPYGTLHASMGPYPGYDGDLSVTGTVRVDFVGNPDPGIKFLQFFYEFEGLESDCVGCGVHIHAGTSCDTPDGPQGHGWNSASVPDMWLPAYGAVYASDMYGKAGGSFYLTNGFGIEDNIHHAVVVHGQSGERLSCGILM